MDPITGKKVVITSYSYGEIDGVLVSLNSDALVYDDEEGRHLLKMNDVIMVHSEGEDVTEEHMGEFRRRVRRKAYIIYSLIVISLPAAVLLYKWWFS